MNWNGYQIDVYGTYAGWRGRLPTATLFASEDTIDSVERRLGEYVVVERELPAGQYIAEYTTESGERRVYAFTVEREDVTITQCRISVA